MTQPPTQDFLNNIDFTTFPSLSAAELNLGFSQLVPNTNGTINDGSVGVGGFIFTADTALNTPQVPNAATIGGTPKWQGYLWIRIPYSSTAGSVVPTGYFWNNSAVNDATFLKWQSTQVNLTAVNAAITALQAAVTTAQITATGAANTANAASTLATAANNNATTANNTASAAADSAATALTNSTTAISTANGASTTANAAAAAAQTAINAVNTINGSTFTSPLVALNALGVGGALVNQPHGLGSAPVIVRAVLVNQIPEQNYNPGDEVDVESFVATGGGGGVDGPAFTYGISGGNGNVYLTQCLTVLQIDTYNKTTGAMYNINVNNWKAKVYARL